MESMTVIATELILDATDAKAAAATYASALRQVQANVERLVGAEQRSHEIMQKQVGLYDRTASSLARGDAALAAYAQRQTAVARAANDNVRDIGGMIRTVGEAAETTTRTLGLVGAAAYVASGRFRELANPAIVAGLRLIPPAAISAGGAMVTALGPAAGFISRLVPPLKVVAGLYAAIKGMDAISDLGAQKIEELSKLATAAGSTGTGVEFFQRQTAAAKAFRLSTDDATDSLKRLNEAMTPRLGGSAFDRRVAELVEAGNFSGNIGVAALTQANTAEERWRAVSILITTAMSAGERLAALDLAEKFLPASMMERLRANGDLLRELQQAADRVKPATIVSEADVAYAAELKRRMDATEETLRNKWKPIQDDLTRLGMNYQESWVSINELLASAVGHGAALYGWLKSIPDVMARAGNADWIKTLKEWMERRGWMTSPEAAGMDVTPGGMTDVQVASERLAAQLRLPAAIQQAMRQATDVATSVYGDRSKQNPAEEAKKTASEFDRLVRSLERTVAAQEADAAAVGKSIGERERLRAEARLMEAAQHDGIAVIKDGLIVNQDYADRIKLVSERLGTAARLSAQLELAQRVRFEAATNSSATSKDATAKPQPATEQVKEAA
ncbi:MAG: hypothetical protein WA210_18160 [Burkholderiaceae bacterium]